MKTKESCLKLSQDEIYHLIRTIETCIFLETEHKVRVEPFIRENDMNMLEKLQKLKAKK